MATSAFSAIALATMLLPLVTLASGRAASAQLAPTAAASPPFNAGDPRRLGAGTRRRPYRCRFGALTTFGALMFAERGWGAAWLAFTALSVAFILGRLAGGHLPDRLGGARVALVCVLIETAGMAMIWLAPSAAVTFAGRRDRRWLLARVPGLRPGSRASRAA